MSNKSINSFLIEKGYNKNDEQITVLKMVELVDEWQEQMQQEKNLNIDFVSQRYTIEDIERCVENWGLCKVEKEYIERFLNGG